MLEVMLCVLMESSNAVAFEFGERDTWIIVKCKDRSGLLLDIIHTLVHFNLSVSWNGSSMVYSHALRFTPL